MEPGRSLRISDLQPNPFVGSASEIFAGSVIHGFHEAPGGGLHGRRSAVWTDREIIEQRDIVIQPRERFGTVDAGRFQSHRADAVPYSMWNAPSADRAVTWPAGLTAATCQV